MRSRSWTHPSWLRPAFFVSGIPVIVASGIAMQFGAKPLYPEISEKFGGGYRDDLIGAIGSSKSTTMRILRDELDLAAA